MHFFPFLDSLSLTMNMRKKSQNSKISECSCEFHGLTHNIILFYVKQGGKKPRICLSHFFLQLCYYFFKKKRKREYVLKRLFISFYYLKGKYINIIAEKNVTSLSTSYYTIQILLGSTK